MEFHADRQALFTIYPEGQASISMHSQPWELKNVQKIFHLFHCTVKLLFHFLYKYLKANRIIWLKKFFMGKLKWNSWILKRFYKGGNKKNSFCANVLLSERKSCCAKENAFISSKCGWYGNVHVLSNVMSLGFGIKENLILLG